MSNNPDTWSDMMGATIAMQMFGLDGIGFMLENGYFGIDLDDCTKNSSKSLSTALVVILNCHKVAKVYTSYARAVCLKVQEELKVLRCTIVKDFL